MLRFFCFIFLFQTLIQPALADCGVFDAEDPAYRYVCAYGTGKSETEAITRARRDGEAQAAKMIDNTMEFRSLSVETLNDVDVVSNTASSGRADVSRLSVIREFTPVCRKGVCSANILYRFPKKEIEHQKERLRAGKAVRPASRTLGRKKASTGLLKLQSNVSDAAVRIDGILFSPKSTDVDINLEEGVHEVFVEHPHYRSFRREIRIVRGGDFPLYVRLEDARAEVRLETLPVSGAEIFLNGEKIGTTPKSFTLNPAQANEIRLTHPEMQDASLSLTGILKKDQSESYAVRMTEKPGFVSIDTSPSGALVYMDRNPFGKTPVRNRQISRGEHAFTVVLDGYENEEAEFTAVGGKTYVKHFELKPRKNRKTTLIPASSSAAVPPTAASERPGPQYQAGEQDKYHSFREKRPVHRPFAAPDAASREEMLMALMKWDYVANLLRVRASYKEEDGGILLFAQTYFDDGAFRDTAEGTFIPVLEQISDKKGSASIDNACSFTGGSECLNRRMKKVCRTETIRTGFWSPDEEKTVCAQETTCSMMSPPGLNRSCHPDYRKTRTVSWNEGKYDRDHRLIVHEGRLKDLFGTVYVLKAPGREAYHTFRSGLRRDPRFGRISAIEKVRLKAVLHLTSGKTAVRETVLNLRKFIRADRLPESADAEVPRKFIEEQKASAGVIFYPRIEKSPEEYKSMFFFDGIKADDVMAVSVSLERVVS